MNNLALIENSEKPGFNQVVTMDLKVHSTSEYVLWCVDDATRLIRGEVIKDKRPETILNALERAWIIGRGLGPGLPEKYFFSDNGGEFRLLFLFFSV